MCSVDSEWAVREALLLCAEGDRWDQAKSHAAQCKVYTMPYVFPAPRCSDVGGSRNSNSSSSSSGGGENKTKTNVHKGNHINGHATAETCTVTKVVTKISCSMQAFTAFITTPQNVQYYEDGVLLCDVIDERGDALWMHTAYDRLPPLDLVTLHRCVAFHLPERLNSNEPLRRFVSSAARRRHGSACCNGASDLLASQVYVYAIRSVAHTRAPPTCDYVRGWVHLSAFVAYEMPGPCVQLSFVHAPGVHAASVLGWCEEKIARMRDLCEMLQRMMLRGTLALQQQLAEASTAVSSPEPREPSFHIEHNPYAPGSLTPARRRVLRPLLKLHAAATWRFVLVQEGCKVEECEARQCLAAPSLLKAYRVSTSIACSLATFFRLVGDPLQTHRYDAFVDNITIIDSEDEGEVVYARCKQLATHTPKRDFCMFSVTALLLHEEAREEQLLPLPLRGDSGMVYVQNALHCSHRPLCEGYERQVVYAFGYVAITEAASDNHVQVHHIVCIDSSCASEQRLEMATIQEHCTRMAWVRQVCEDSQRTTMATGATTAQRTAVACIPFDKDNNKNDMANEKKDPTVFTDILTLEESISLDQSFRIQTNLAGNDDFDMTFEELEEIFEPYSSSTAPLVATATTMTTITTTTATTTKAAGAPFRRASPVARLNPSLNVTIEESPVAATAPVPEPPPLPKPQPAAATTTATRALVEQDSWLDVEDEEQPTNAAPCHQCTRQPPQQAPQKQQQPTQQVPEQQKQQPRTVDFLQVDVLACRHLTTQHTTRHHLFILLRTSAARAQTALVAFTRNPVFHSEQVCFEGPQGNAMSITAVLQTASGKVRRFGMAIISLRNLHGSAPQTRRVALVRKFGRSDAHVCGEVCLTLRGGGLNARPGAPLPVEAEESLRRRIRHVLIAAGRRDLHRLEWLVGNCSSKTPREIDAVLARYKRNRQEIVTATVVDVRGLTTAMGVPLLNRPACHVRLEANGTSCCTRVVPLQQTAVFNQSFQFPIGAEVAIRVMVFAAAAKVGEVLVVAALQEGIRTHTLVRAAGTSEATPCGSITLALLSNISSRETSKNSYSSSGGRDRRRRRRPRVHFDHAETSKRIERLRLFLWKHRRSALHRLDVIATSVHNLDRYMKTIGPEPPYCNLRVTVNRWEASAPEWDSPTEASAATATVIDLGSASSGTGFSKRAIVYAVVQAGLHHCATGIVRTSNTGVGEFNHTVTLQGILPERDELVIAVVSKGFAGTEDAEMGLAVLSLRTLARKTETVLTLPLVRHAGSSDAHFKGLVQVRLFAVNFGGVPILSKGPTAFRERVQRLLYRYAPEQLHRTESLLVDYAGREGELVRELEQQYGPDVISSPMEIRIIGIRDFAPASGCYVKVYLDGEAVLRTSQHDGATHITFAANDVKNSVTVELYDPQHSRLRFKVAQHRYLQSITMSFAEIRLRNMVAGTANECWVPLFDSDGGLIGRLGVVLKSDGFIHREAAEVVRACEDVENDVASLLRKYRPRALPLLQPIMTETSNLETAHAEIRSRVATRPVAATVYVCIDSLCINRPDARQQQQRDWDEGGTHGEQTQTVTVNCDREEASIIWSAPEERQGAVVRLDIPDVGRRGHHELVITVKRQAAASGSLSRSGKVKSRSTSRSSRATSSRHTIHQTSSQAAEFGRVVVSLRALLTPSLYDASERITLPLVALMQESPVRKTLQQQSILQQQPSVVDVGFPCNDVIGEITLSVRLPVLEQVPSWLQLSSAQVEKHVAVDRAYIRYYEEQIRHLLADHEPHSLLDLHYTLYERDVAFGKWNLSLRDWKRALQRRFGVVNALPDSPPSCAAHAIKVGSGGAKVNAAEVDSYEEQSMCEK